ncbi:MAG: DUF1326 domain-containing protein [Acidobacteria bacterium]|nr:DUF1326 domain-containing protein [Acidobacteriota bacterium]
MATTSWTIKGREFVNCNCSYGCPCQFNGLPTYGFCQAVAAMEIHDGFHGDTPLGGLRFVGMFRWPGPIHEGHGEAAIVLDERATAAQRSALLRILTGEDTEPGATIFSVFKPTLETLHEPLSAPIDFKVDVDGRRATLRVPGIVETRGEPIVNPVTGREHRARIDLPNGFEYSIAEIGRGWTTTERPFALQLADSYGQFANIHLSQSGVVR